jgi:hypothetical protein
MRDARAKQEKQEAKEQKKALAMERKKQIQEIWERTETGQEFLDELQYAGYGVAKGDRRTKHTELNQDGQLTKNRFVLIDQHGQVSNLSRDLPRLVKRADIADRLGELQHGLKSVEETRQEVIERQQFYDREQAEIDRQNRELAAMDRDAKEKARLEEQQRKEALLAEAEQKKAEARKEHAPAPQPQQLTREQRLQHSKPKLEELKPQTPANDDHLVKLDREQEWSRVAGTLRAQHNKKMEEFYKAREHERRIKELRAEVQKSDTWLGKVSGKNEQLQQDLENAEKSYLNMQQRLQEQNENFEAKLEDMKPAELKPKPPDVTPEPEPEPKLVQEKEQVPPVSKEFKEVARDENSYVPANDQGVKPAPEQKPEPDNEPKREERRVKPEPEEESGQPSLSEEFNEVQKKSPTQSEQEPDNIVDLEEERRKKDGIELKVSNLEQQELSDQEQKQNIKANQNTRKEITDIDNEALQQSLSTEFNEVGKGLLEQKPDNLVDLEEERQKREIEAYEKSMREYFEEKAKDRDQDIDIGF